MNFPRVENYVNALLLIVTGTLRISSVAQCGTSILMLTAINLIPPQMQNPRTSMRFNYIYRNIPRARCHQSTTITVFTSNREKDKTETFIGKNMQIASCANNPSDYYCKQQKWNDTRNPLDPQIVYSCNENLGKKNRFIFIFRTKQFPLTVVNQRIFCILYTRLWMVPDLIRKKKKKKENSSNYDRWSSYLKIRVIDTRHIYTLVTHCWFVANRRSITERKLWIKIWFNKSRRSCYPFVNPQRLTGCRYSCNIHIIFAGKWTGKI